jgi:hypothetical protein
MTYAAMLLPLILASLFMIAAVHAELSHPRHFPRLTTPMRAPSACAPIPVAAPLDPAAAVAFNVAEFERRYGIPPMTTCDRGAARL